MGYPVLGDSQGFCVVLLTEKNWQIRNDSYFANIHAKLYSVVDRDHRSTENASYSSGTVCVRSSVNHRMCFERSISPRAKVASEDSIHQSQRKTWGQACPEVLSYGLHAEAPACSQGTTRPSYLYRLSQKAESVRPHCERIQ